ncbi:spore coat protein CotJB [Clostridiisalibacter paucivorans]|uniref:spore coat protein CotJB n=1 Tax=Clostridiisalibacter paucivorans TaxID=408753 RepID=UPI00047AA86F|nr:spore coat protein CotJB [Clostridiisalibacter paucivorans]
MRREQLDLLVKLMEIEFCLLETALYLDTHPTDERALRLHNDFSKRCKEIEDMYTSKYGPIRNSQMSDCPWQYIKSPWPWEIDYCGCN